MWDIFCCCGKSKRQSQSRASTTVAVREPRSVTGSRALAGNVSNPTRAEFIQPRGHDGLTSTRLPSESSIRRSSAVGAPAVSRPPRVRSAAQSDSRARAGAGEGAGAGVFEPRSRTARVDTTVKLLPLDKLPTDISEYVLSYLDRGELNTISVCSTYWHNISRGEIMVRWCKLASSSARLSGLQPQRFSPHRQLVLKRLPSSEIPYGLYEREKARSWIFKVTKIAAQLHFVEFCKRNNRFNTRRLKQIYDHKHAVNHLVFRGCNEDPKYVFAKGFRVGRRITPGQRDRLRNRPAMPQILESETSGYISATVPRSVISTSYSLSPTRMYTGRSGWIYICVPHRGFNLTSGSYLEIAELGIPNRFVLCAMKFHGSARLPHEVVLNKYFYDQGFMFNFMDAFDDIIPEHDINFHLTE